MAKVFPIIRRVAAPTASEPPMKDALGPATLITVDGGSSSEWSDLALAQFDTALAQGDQGTLVYGDLDMNALAFESDVLIMSTLADLGLAPSEVMAMRVDSPDGVAVASELVIASLGFAYQAVAPQDDWQSIVARHFDTNVLPGDNYSVIAAIAHAESPVAPNEHDILLISGFADAGVSPSDALPQQVMRIGGSGATATGSLTSPQNVTGLTDRVYADVHNGGGISVVNGSVEIPYPVVHNSSKAISHAELRLYWFDSGSTINTGSSITLDYSKNGGSTWATPWRYSVPSLGTTVDNSTTPIVVDISSVISTWADLSNFKTRVRVTIGGLQTADFWIDAVELAVTTTP